MKKIIKYLLFVGMLFIPMFKVDAATGLIDIYSSSKKVLVGNSITVTAYCKSSTTIGTCEYTLTYDANKLKLTSVGDTVSCKNTFCVYYAGNKSSYKKFTFKVIASGTSTISAKSYSLIGLDENEMSTSVSGTSITGITQSQLEASYSTNNYLSNLSITNHTLSPAFNKNTTEYKVTLGPEVEKITINATRDDNTASVSGAGTIDVSEGDNKIDITVTSQKGTKRTYTIIATVVDNNPINVTIDEKNYTVVKKNSILKKPNTYIENKITINELEVPGFYSEITNYKLVGLKDSEGNIFLAIYDDVNNTYTLYNELSFNNLTLNILNEKINIPENYKETSITINDNLIKAYKYDNNSKYSIFYAINIETGQKNLYMYDEKENTVQIYNQEEINKLEKKIDFANILIIALGSTSLFLAILLILVAAKKAKEKNKVLNKRNKIKETKSDDKKEETKEEIKKEKVKNTKVKKDKPDLFDEF